MSDRDPDRPPAAEPAHRPLTGLLARAGGMVLSPAATLDRVAAGGPGGLSDLLWLLGLQVVSIHLPQLVRAVWYMAVVGGTTGGMALLNLVSEAVVVQIAAAFFGSLPLSWLAPRGVAVGRRLDLAALCVVPLVLLQGASSLLLVVTGATVRPWMGLAMVAAGGLWLVLLLALAAFRLRRLSPAAPGGEPGPGSRGAVLAGGALVGLMALLAGLNLSLVVRHRELLRPVGPGRIAPGFSLRDLEGRKVDLARLRGQVVLVNFWATWCGPCVRELPRLEWLQRRLGRHRLQVLAINVDAGGDAGRVRAFVEAHIGKSGRDRPGPQREAAGLQLQVLLDDGTLAVRYGVQTLPHTVLVDGRGLVRWVRVGEASEAELERQVTGLLGEAAHSERPTP